MITLRNKIGQMLIMGFSGCEIHEHSPVARWLAQDGLGGVLLFDYDVATKTYGKNLKNFPQIKHLTHQLNHYADQLLEADDQRLPLFTAIDYEGGAIDRLSQIEGCLPTMRAYDMTHLPVQSLESELGQMAETLVSLGFNLNFAPVVDLHMHEEHGIIGALHRSFSPDPQVVTRMARQFVHVFHQYGIATCYKHFPGHGSALGDTHEGFVDVSDTFKEEELIPYAALAQEGEQPTMVMTAHVINKHLDSQGLPATLSYPILTGLLREKMHYKGIIISDDLQMQAITQLVSLDKALELTINAGADMIIFANQLDYIEAPELIDRIESLVMEKKISLQRIEDAYRRIVRLKQQVGRLETC